MKDLINFLQQDCLYLNTYNYLKNSKMQDKEISLMMQRAGFIKEPRTINDSLFLEDYSIISMPLNPKHDTKNAIIVSTGSFSPMHEGHVQAMIIAKEYVKNLGYNIIQGVMSLSHDAYVSTKNNGIAKKHISERTMLAYEKIDEMNQGDWLKIDRMEGEMVSCAINFSTVLKRLYNYTQHHLNIDDLTVFYVFGSDNIEFSNAFINNEIYHAICVEREGYNNSDKKLLNSLTDNIHYLKNDSQYKGYSSTQVRKSENKKEKKIFNNKKKIYLIRENGSNEKFNQNLKKVFEKYISKDIEVRLFKTENIEINKNTISLDKFEKSVFNIDTSRQFEISSYQKRAKKMISLTKSLKEQINSIPPGDYDLLDDDSVSGYTIEKIKEVLFERDVKINNVRMLIDMYIKEDEILYDVVDARDFLINKNEHQGLVVENFKNKNIRIPYIFPEVNLTTRASINPIDQIAFSKDICDINLILNEKIDKNKVKDLINLYNNFLYGE